MSLPGTLIRIGIVSHSFRFVAAGVFMRESMHGISIIHAFANRL